MTRVVNASDVTARVWVFMWAPLQGETLAASLGYFLMPLVMVLIGHVVYREPMSRWQLVATGLACVFIPCGPPGYLELVVLVIVAVVVGESLDASKLPTYPPIWLAVMVLMLGGHTGRAVYEQEAFMHRLTLT